HEQDVLAVGRPAGRDVVGGVEGEAARLAALGGDDEDVVGAVPLGGEGEGAAVGAEARVEVVGEVLGDGSGDAADTRHGPDVAEVAEGDELAVGRDVGSAGHADRLLRPGGGGR